MKFGGDGTGTDYVTALRYKIDIAPFPAVVSAVITFYSNTSDTGTGDKTVRMCAYNIGNSPAIPAGLAVSTLESWVSNATSHWLTWNDTTQWLADASPKYSGNFCEAIGEVLGRSDWSSGNYLTVLLVPESSAVAYHRPSVSGSVSGVLTILFYPGETFNGGIKAGGSATMNVIAHHYPTGGVNVAGDPSYYVMTSRPASGGIVLGGVASYWKGVPIVASGGCVVGGAATHYKYNLLWMTGGVLCSSPQVGHGFNYRQKFMIPWGTLDQDFENFYLSYTNIFEASAVGEPDFLLTDEDDHILGAEFVWDEMSGRLHVFWTTDLYAEKDNIWFIYFGKSS